MFNIQFMVPPAKGMARTCPEEVGYIYMSYIYIHYLWDPYISIYISRKLHAINSSTLALVTTTSVRI